MHAISSCKKYVFALLKRYVTDIPIKVGTKKLMNWPAYSPDENHEMSGTTQLNV